MLSIQVIQDMISKGVILDAAMGGATAVIYYTEPFSTEDIDFFVLIPEGGSLFLPLDGIYRYAEQHDFKTSEEHILIGEDKVQFLPVFNKLTEDAVADASQYDIDGSQVKILSPEYLVAIMLHTGRHKDFLKLRLLLDQTKINKQKLKLVLRRHKLEEAWKKFNA